MGYNKGGSPTTPCKKHSAQYWQFPQNISEVQKKEGTFLLEVDINNSCLMLVNGSVASLMYGSNTSIQQQHY